MAALASVCSRESLDAGEPLAATASRADWWLLVELRDAWPRDPLDGGLPEAVLAHVRGQLAALSSPKLLYVRRPGRRGAARRVYVAHTSDRDASLRAFDIESYERLLDFDLSVAPGERASEPLAIVCTHGKRDPCCARFGPAVYDELRQGPLGEGVWQSSHLGGHRFAANVVLLPDGLMYGRMSPGAAVALGASHRRREILLSHYRGRCAYTPAAQAAERALREREGLVGIDDLELDGAERGGAVTRVRFRLRRTGDLREIEVEEAEGAALPLSCGEPLEATRRLTVRAGAAG